MIDDPHVRGRAAALSAAVAPAALAATRQEA
jgi:hypothetical protein